MSTSLEPTVPATPSPTLRDVLSWCAAVAPKIWFPSDHARDTGIPRQSIDEPLWAARQAGLMQVGDWIRGRGQGFVLTPAGEKALAQPDSIPIGTEPPPAIRSDIPPAVPPTAEDLRRAAVPPAPTTFDRGERAREAVLGARQPIVTTILMFANVAWFLLGATVAWRMDVRFADYLEGNTPEVLARIGAVYGQALVAGDWWRLLTAGFVHVGMLHLLANMFGLFILGPIAEAMWGRKRFLLLYLLAGITGNCLAMAREPGVILAGASGSIWGVMTMIVAWLVLYRSHLPVSVVQSQLRGLIIVMLINAVLSAAPGISWECHLGGGLTGFVGAWLLDHVRPGLGLRRVAAIVGFVGLVLAGPLLLEVGIHSTEKWERLRGIRVFHYRMPDETSHSSRLAPRVVTSGESLVHRGASFQLANDSTASRKLAPRKYETTVMAGSCW